MSHSSTSPCCLTGIRLQPSRCELRYRRPTSSIVLVTCIHQRTTGVTIFTIQFYSIVAIYSMRVTCYCLCIDSQLIRNVVCLSDILRVLVQDLLFLFLIFIFRSLGYSPFSCTPYFCSIYCYTRIHNTCLDRVFDTQSLWQEEYVLQDCKGRYMIPRNVAEMYHPM